MAVEIVAERPDTDEARALIEELTGQLVPYYPPESCHGYDVEKLLSRGVAFFVVRVDGAPAGCGGVELHGTVYGEIKRMYVRRAFRGLGLAKRMVERLEAHALERGVAVLRLETGILQREAIGLYEKLGFERIGPFGEYREDPLSVFFEKRLR